jgi:hypothetical protein
MPALIGLTALVALIAWTKMRTSDQNKVLGIPETRKDDQP